MAQFRVTALSAERPFPGLRPFAAEDHEFFCGRDAQIYALYRLIDISRFVAVIGSSGSGKSSLVRAGLFPLLDEENAGGGKRTWLRAEMRPGNAPLNELVRAFTDLSWRICANNAPSVAAAREDRIAYRVGASSRGIADALGEIDGIAGKSLVLAVDQFEELFRYSSATPEGQPNRAEATRSRDEAAHFVQLLLEASRSQALDVHVLLTMRSDFIGDCARFQGLPEAVSATQFLVPSLTRDQREQVIRKPLEHAHASIESALIDRLLNDTPDELDQLPVLQHCLLRLWEQAGASAATEQAHADTASGARHLTLEQYRQIGGIENALSCHANEILGRIGRLEPIVARVFRALSEFDNNHRAIRRARSFSQLCDETAADKNELREVLDQFRSDDCSFLTASPPGAEFIEDKAGIDISHEALLRRWDRVRGDPEATGAANDPRPIGWMREEEEDGRHYQALLYLGDLPPSDIKNTLAWWTKLPRTPAWAARYGGGYNRVQQLLERGQSALEAEQARQRRLASLEKKLTWIVRGGISGAMLIGCLLLALLVGLALTLNKQRQVEQQNYNYALRSTIGLIRPVGDAFNSGGISTAAAKAIATLLEGNLDKLQQPPEIESGLMKLLLFVPRLLHINPSQGEQPPRIVAVRADLLLTLSDIFATLGDTQRAKAQAESAQILANQLASADPGNADWQNLVYCSLFRIADVETDSSDKSRIQQGLNDYQAAQRIAQALKDKSPGNPARLYDLAFIDNKVAETFELLENSSEAINEFNDALAIARQIAAIPSATIEQQAYLPSTLTKIGDFLVKTDPDRSLDAALADYKEAISLQQGLLAKSPGDDVVTGNLLLSHRSYGDGLVRQAVVSQGDFQPAFSEYEAAIAVGEQLLDKDTGNTLWLSYLASAYHHYGNGLKAANRLNDALAQYKKELNVRRKLAKKDPTNSGWQNSLKTIKNEVDKLQETLSQTPAPGSAKDPTNRNSATEVKP